MGKAELRIEIDADLLKRAQDSGRPLAELVEEGLRSRLPPEGVSEGDDRALKWAEDNAEAIADYNRRIAERGLFGDEFRKW